MLKRIFLGVISFAFLSLFLNIRGFAQEDKIVRVAIETIRAQMRLPQGTEVKFIEKKESPLHGFYSVKLSVLTPDKEIPLIIYVDTKGERVILGSLFIKGQNVTRKEAGEPKSRKIDMSVLAIDQSPVRGSSGAKVTVVEFSNFQCPYCLRSWKEMKEFMEKHPKDIRYVFKHFPFQLQGKTFELSEMVAATQAVNDEAFWAVHDFFFSDEGQIFVNTEKEVLKQKVEEILKGKGYDEKAFEAALVAGKGRKRVEEDMAIGSKIPVTGTPTTIVNGDLITTGVNGNLLERYLGKSP